MKCSLGGFTGPLEMITGAKRNQQDVSGQVQLPAGSADRPWSFR